MNNIIKLKLFSKKTKIEFPQIYFIKNPHEYFKKYNMKNIELIDMENYSNSIKTESIAYKNTLYIWYTYNIMYNNLKNNGKWYFYDFFNNNSYEVYNFICPSPDITVYFFNKDNPIFIIINFTYREISYIGYINKNLIINISHSTSGCNTLEYKIKMGFSYLKQESIKFGHLLNKQNLCFGFVSNVGHHLWNEVTGLLLFLKYPENFKYINNIYIGNYDCFNIKKYLIENYSFNIIDNNNDVYLSKTELPIFFTSFIINEDIQNLFNNLFDLNNKYENDICKNDVLEIGIDIRTGTRIMINSIDVYKNLINIIYDKYNKFYKIKIYFLGRFQTNVNKINKQTDKDCIDQNIIMNDIINFININNINITYENLIGESIFLIIKKIINIKFSILTGGTSISNLLNWIYKKNVIGLCNKHFYTLVNDIQYDCLKNYNLAIPPIDFITDAKDSNFYINDINKLNTWFINILEGMI